MAKQRCLPTSFFKDPDVMSLSSGDVRLILVGLVLGADDEGRGLAHASILGRELDYPPEVIEEALQEMEALRPRAVLPGRAPPLLPPAPLA